MCLSIHLVQKKQTSLCLFVLPDFAVRITLSLLCSSFSTFCFGGVSSVTMQSSPRALRKVLASLLCPQLQSVFITSSQIATAPPQCPHTAAPPRRHQKDNQRDVFLQCHRRTSLFFCGGSSAASPLHTSRPLYAAVTPTAAAEPSSSLTVSPVLIEQINEVLVRFSPGTWHPVSAMYNELPPTSRRVYVRPHKTLWNVLTKVHTELSITLDPTGVYFAKGSPPPPPQPDHTGGAHGSSPASSSSSSSSSGAPEASGSTTVPAPSLLQREAVPLGKAASPPVDFYYDVGLTTFPEAPPDFDVTPSSLRGAQASADGSVISLASFLAFIPPFFVPVSTVLENMPGYTEEHFDSYLRSKAMELVQVGGQRLVRLYGGYGKLSLAGCEAAEVLYPQYRPDPTLLPHFVSAFGGITEQWMPLRVLLSRTDPAAVGQLPFQGPASIAYFAQMQHVFAFSVDQSGQGSVLLRQPGYTGLDCHTSPTPKSANTVLRLLPIDGSVDVSQLAANLPPEVVVEVERYFGGLLPFLRAHGELFFVSDDSSVVMRVRYKHRLDVAALPLEEQLRIALDRKDKKRVRTLRRRIAFRDNPSHPFHDPDNIAREVAKYLPRRGFVVMKTFLKKNVPEELLGFLPMKMLNFFSGYPQYFQKFEYQQPGAWCLSRPGQPLPRGVIRQSFTEDELVRLIAEHLQRKGSRSCTAILLHLPRGAQEVIRKRYGGMYYLVEKFPNYFTVVVNAESSSAVGSAVVHLVRLPTAGEVDVGPSPTAMTSSAEGANGSREGGDDGGGEVGEQSTALGTPSYTTSSHSASSRPSQAPRAVLSDEEDDAMEEEDEEAEHDEG